MTFLSEFDIRYSEEKDLPFLLDWFAPEGSCDPFPFDTEEKEETLRNWVGFSRFKAGLTGTIKGVPCALGCLFLMPYRKVAHQCSFFLMVDPQHRRKGIGTSMIRNLMHLAKTRFRLESMYVEIYDPNPVYLILEKQGFKEFARQENFIQVNGQLHSRVFMEHFFA